MKPKFAEVDLERKHLERLLTNRINFYLIFAPVYLQFVHQIGIESRMGLFALGIGTFVSVLLGLAIWRTHCLVQKALDEIVEFKPPHPYARYKQEISFPWNANKVLLWIPLVITFLFIVLTCSSFLAVYCPR